MLQMEGGEHRNSQRLKHAMALKSSIETADTGPVERPPPELVAEQERRLQSGEADAVRESLDFFSDCSDLIDTRLLNVILQSKALNLCPCSLFACLRQCRSHQNFAEIVIGSGIIGEIILRLGDTSNPDVVVGAMRLFATLARCGDEAMRLLVSSGIVDCISESTKWLLEGQTTGPSAMDDRMHLFDAIVKAATALIRPICDCNLPLLERIASECVSFEGLYASNPAIGMSIPQRVLKFVRELWGVGGSEWLCQRRDLVDCVMEHVKTVGVDSLQVSALRTLIWITARDDEFSAWVVRDYRFLEMLELFKTEEARKYAACVLRNVAACAPIFVRDLTQKESVEFLRYVLRNDSFATKTIAYIVIAYIITAGFKDACSEFLADEALTREFTETIADANEIEYVRTGMTVLYELVLMGEENSKETGSRNKVALWIGDTITPEFWDRFRDDQSRKDGSASIGELAEQLRQQLDHARLFDQL